MIKKDAVTTSVVGPGLQIRLDLELFWTCRTRNKFPKSEGIQNRIWDLIDVQKLSVSGISSPVTVRCRYGATQT
jgi:hypothetical protein